MTLVKFVDGEWGPVGSFNWFATHGTSMSRTNSLISGDNKGAAARFMEDWFEQNGARSSYDSGAYEIPRRVSNIIPNLHESRTLLFSSQLISWIKYGVCWTVNLNYKDHGGFEFALFWFISY